MHEMGLAESVVSIVEDNARAAGAARVALVRLEIGALSQVIPEAMEFCFDAVSKGTLAEGAILEIERSPGQAWCHDCMAKIEIPALGSPCPTCGGYKLQVTGGEEMRVKEMEIA